MFDHSNDTYSAIPSCRICRENSDSRAIFNVLYIANVKTEPLMDLERGRPCILTEIPPVMPSNQRAQWLLMPKE